MLSWRELLQFGVVCKVVLCRCLFPTTVIYPILQNEVPSGWDLTCFVGGMVFMLHTHTHLQMLCVCAAYVLSTTLTKG